MATVDYEAAWQALKAVVVAKRSHGARDLALEMQRIEVEYAVPEDQAGFDPGPLIPRRNGRTRPSTGAPA